MDFDVIVIKYHLNADTPHVDKKGKYKNRDAWLGYQRSELHDHNVFAVCKVQFSQRSVFDVVQIVIVNGSGGAFPL